MRTWQEAINGEHVDARELRQIADAGVPAEVLGQWVRTLPIPMPRASDVHRIMDAAQQFPDPMSLQGKVALVKHRPDRRYWYGDRVGVVAALALMRDDDVKPLVPSGRPAGRGRSLVPAHNSGMPTINPGAAANREQARRSDGKFGTTTHAEQDTLGPTGLTAGRCSDCGEPVDGGRDGRCADDAQAMCSECAVNPVDRARLGDTRCADCIALVCYECGAELAEGEGLVDGCCNGCNGEDEG